MNIVFLLRFWPIYGGGENVTRLLANKLIELGYDVSVLYLWERKRADMPFVNINIKQHKINSISDPDGEDGIKKGDNRKVENFLHRYFINNNTDIIINQWMPAVVVHRARKGVRAKLVCCHHTAVHIKPSTIIMNIKQKIFFFVFKDIGIFLYALKRLCPAFKYSDRLVMLSDSYVEDCKKLFRIFNNVNKICSIPNPLTYEQFIQNSEVNIKEKELLFVGRILESVKRISYIIDIWKELRKKERYDDWWLTIVGEGPDLDNLKKYASDSACANVYFEGYQTPLNYYRRASIFLMTSSFEGWGMTLVEAQQNGCVPVAMDSYSSLHEIVKHGVNGIIVPDNDVPAFVSALETLMQDNEYRLKLMYNGIEMCKQFSIDNIIKRWETLFREIVENP